MADSTAEPSFAEAKAAFEWYTLLANGPIPYAEAQDIVESAGTDLLAIVQFYRQYNKDKQTTKDCVCCGACCSGWSVDGIPIEDDENVGPALYYLIKGKRYMKMLRKIDSEGREYNSCIALDSDGRCSIHYMCKPRACQKQSCTKAGGTVQARYRFAIGKSPE